MAEARPSLKSLPPEVLVHVFARLTHVKSKIRLERVNRKFRDCIRLPESWQFDDRLRLADFTMRGLSAFLKRTVVITRLDISYPANRTRFDMDARFLSALWEHAEKLNISHLICNNACSRTGVDFMMGYVFGRFKDSLRSLEFACDCQMDEFRTEENELYCHTQSALFMFAAPCKGLEKVSLHSLHLQKQSWNFYTQEIRRRLPALAGKPLKRLEVDVGYGNLEGERGRQLIAVLNSPKSRIHSLTLTSKSNYSLSAFCRGLQPHAAQSLKNLTVKMAAIDYVLALPLLPTLLPALLSVELFVTKSAPENLDPLDVAEALGSFLSAGRERVEAIELKLRLISPDNHKSQEFMSKLWKAVNVLSSVLRSGTRRGQNLGDRWSRVLKDGNATATIFAQKYGQ